MNKNNIIAISNSNHFKNKDIICDQSQVQDISTPATLNKENNLPVNYGKSLIRETLRF